MKGNSLGQENVSGPESLTIFKADNQEDFMIGMLSTDDQSG